MSEHDHPGLRANLGQFSLLVLVNAFVGAMVGLERTTLPLLAEDEFEIAARSAILGFIVVFGITKALANYFAGRASDVVGRKPILLLGWFLAAPVPFILMEAQHWHFIVAANALLGASQGLTWSATVIMKIDLAGPRRRGLAMGLNEFAGYLAVGASAWATGYLAARHGLRPEPFYLGVGYVAVGLLLSLAAVRETRPPSAVVGSPPPSGGALFMRVSLRDRDLSSVTWAGLVNNLNDGMAWGLFPLLFATGGLSIEDIGWLAAAYPATWGVGQLVTGAWSDRVGRKVLIVAGMVVQGGAILLVALGEGFSTWLVASVALGLGTALVYPTLLAAVGDVAAPSWRASAVGVYRLWRDLGYAFGAVIAGVVADLWGLRSAVGLVAALTLAAGLVVAVRMRETLGNADDGSRVGDM